MPGGRAFCFEYCCYWRGGARVVCLTMPIALRRLQSGVCTSWSWIVVVVVDAAVAVVVASITDLIRRYQLIGDAIDSAYRISYMDTILARSYRTKEIDTILYL